MPVWVQAIGAITGIIALLTALWTKVLRPGAKLISSTEEMLPLLRELTGVFRSSPGVFLILREIADQFRANSGSSLRDVVDRLEQAAMANKTASEALKVGVETSRLLAERDRKQLDRLLILLDRLAIRVDAITAHDSQVAVALETREVMLDEATADVAHELRAAQERADAAANSDDAEPGSAADAASGTPPEEEVDESGLTREEITAAWNRLERRAEANTGPNLGRRAADRQ